jgi:glutathione S-transferase
MLQLHYFPGSASLIPHILLEELGVPYEPVVVDRTVRRAQVARLPASSTPMA